MARRDSYRVRYFILAFCTSFLLLFSIAAAFLAWENTLPAPAPRQTPVQASSSQADFYYPDPAHSLTVLFIGSEKKEDVAYTYILVQFNPEDGQIPVFAFPPQTIVEVNGSSSPLSDVYRYGGYALVLQSLQETFGIRIDRYVRMQWDNFLKIADAIGSVEYNLKFDVTSPAGSGVIPLTKGLQLIDGKKALNILTYQNFPGGELTRAEIAAEFTAQIINNRLDTALSPTGEILFKTIINLIDTDISYLDFEERQRAAEYMTRLGYLPAANLPITGEYSQDGSAFTLSSNTTALLSGMFS